MKYENRYGYFLDKMRSVRFNKSGMMQKNIRIPKEIWKLINEELREFEDEGEKISYNDYVLYTIISNLNITQNEKGEWKTGNKMGYDYFKKNLQ